MGVFETLTVIISTKYFHWTEVKTGIIFSVCGIIGVGTLIQYSLLLTLFKDYQLIPISLILIMISCLLLNNNYFFFTYGYYDAFLVTSLFLTVSLGYPIVHATLMGLFSRSVGSREKQGEALGLFSSSGSLARIIFPFLSGAVIDSYEHYNIIFLTLAIILFIALIVYYRMRDEFEKILG